MIRITNCFRHLNILSKAVLQMLLFAVILQGSAVVAMEPEISKVFSPNEIGPGSVSTITIAITNTDTAPITALGFNDTLPAAMTIASPANASTSCDLGLSGTFSAPDDGTQIILNDAQLGAGLSCTVTVDVTASTIGVYTNPVINLTSSAGASESPPTDLTVVSTRPGFSKSFSPSSVSVGERSTITFSIDNTMNASRVGNLDFTDALPVGMVVADPALASTDCVSAAAPNTTITAIPGTSTIILDADGITFSSGFEVLPIGAVCTVTVDVITTGAGLLNNISGDLLADFTSAGSANATLEATQTSLSIQKSFIDDPVAPGGSVTIEFTLDNRSRDFSATAVAFSDDLTTISPALAGLTATSILSNDCNGAVDISSASNIAFSGGTLPLEGSCTIRVALTVPAATTPGPYSNTTSSITGTVDGSPVVGNTASDVLFVDTAPSISKQFLSNPVKPGDTTELQFTITNLSSNSPATDIVVEDSFASILATASVEPPTECCGVGSS